MNKNVVITLTNPIEIDNRVCNEAHSLISAGFNVIVYAWDRERRYSNKIDDIFDGIKIRRVLVKSSYGQGLRQLYGFMCFWTIIFFRLMVFNFDAVHCVDLNTLVPGFIAAKIKGKKIIYDSHENFPAAMLDGEVRNLSFFAEKVESFIIKRVDLLVTVSEPIAQVLRSRGAKKIHVVPTTKPLSEYSYSQKQLLDLRKNLGVENKFIFLYMGLLYHHRNLLEIIEIFRNYVSDNNVFLIGGYGTLEEDIRKAAKTCKNVRYIGRVLANEISLYTKAADVIFAVNKSTSENSNITIPNKLFEAIAAGKPIIGSNIGPLGQIIKETNCGIAVNPDDINEIKNVILRLSSDANMYSQLCTDAVKSQKIYNWEITSNILVSAYKELLNG